MAQHSFKREKGGVGLGRVGELTQQAGRICLHAYKVAESTRDHFRFWLPDSKYV